jgi:delta-aminolevulinic acid dehydratase/porphobilinogen synthase
MIKAEAKRATGAHLDDEVILTDFAVPDKASHGRDGLVRRVKVRLSAVVAVLLAHLVHLHAHAASALFHPVGHSLPKQHPSSVF